MAIFLFLEILYYRTSLSSSAIEFKEIPEVIMTVPVVFADVAAFSTWVAPIFPVTSFAIMRLVPICPTVIAADRIRTAWTALNLWYNQHKYDK